MANASDYESMDLRHKFEPWLWDKLQKLEAESPDRYVSLIIRSPGHAEKAQLAEILEKSVDVKNMEVLKALPVILAHVKVSSVMALASNPLVKRIGDGEAEAVACADVATEVIGARRVWETYGLNGSGITIAILDTGINATHPDLDDLDDNPNTTDPKVIAHKSFALNTTAPPPAPSELEGPEDFYGHGTWCAGLAAGTGYASSGTYKGAAPGAQLVNVKVLNRAGEGLSGWIVAGLDWVIANKDAYNIKVVSMSLGFVRYPPYE
jgi:serine protease AprX